MSGTSMASSGHVNTPLSTLTEDVEELGSAGSSPGNNAPSKPLVLLPPRPHDDATIPTPTLPPHARSALLRPPSPIPPSSSSSARSTQRDDSNRKSVQFRRFPGNKKQLSITPPSHEKRPASPNPSNSSLRRPPSSLQLMPSMASRSRETLPEQKHSHAMLDPGSSTRRNSGHSTSTMLKSIDHNELGVHPGGHSPRLTKTTFEPRDPHPSPTKLLPKVRGAPPPLQKAISSGSLRSIKALKPRASSVSTEHMHFYQAPISPKRLHRKKSIAVGPHPSTVPLQYLSSAAKFTTSVYGTCVRDPIVPKAWESEALDAPFPLEPCPQSFLLRPYWLLRCMYQTIAHPRGGYLTHKLYVPKEIWQTPNVKIKAMQEKISICDFLTSALAKIASVDEKDWEEIRNETGKFDRMLEQVKASLSKKLGNDVGQHGAQVAMRQANADTGSSEFSKGIGSTRSYFPSWRKLRSKSGGLSSSVGPIPVPSKGKNGDPFAIPSVPMSDTMDTQDSSPPPRYLKSVQCTGPNAQYMISLVTLFDAAQVLDRIAREMDNGKMTLDGQASVDLQFSIRHASEFFGLYVCRFIMNDISLLLDKFIKRGTDWMTRN